MRRGASAMHQNGAPGDDLLGAPTGAPRACIGRGVAPEIVNDAHAAQEAARARDRALREPYASISIAFL